MITTNQRRYSPQLLRDSLSATGIALVDDGGSVCRSNLLNLESDLGFIIPHNLSESDGIYEVAEHGSENSSYGKGHSLQPPHTDSPFRPSPPAIVAFQCVRHAPIGGETILVRGDEIYAYLSRHNPLGLEALTSSLATAWRSNFRREVSVFCRTSKGFQIAFRRDKSAGMQATGAAADALDEIETYVNNPSRQLRLPLRSGQILVLDNTRVLHGRTAFPPGCGRMLRRLWFDGNHPSISLGFPISMSHPSISTLLRLTYPSAEKD